MQFLPSALLVTITTYITKNHTHNIPLHIPQNKCKTSRPQTTLACCFGSSFLYFICVGCWEGEVWDMKFGRIAFSFYIPSCHSLVSSIPQLSQLVRRGKLLHQRDPSCGFAEQLKLTPFYFCINGPLAIARFRLLCSSLDSCLCNPTGFKARPSSLLQVTFVPVFLFDTS